MLFKGIFQHTNKSEKILFINCKCKFMMDKNNQNPLMKGYSCDRNVMQSVVQLKIMLQKPINISNIHCG